MKVDNNRIVYTERLSTTCCQDCYKSSIKTRRVHPSTESPPRDPLKVGHLGDRMGPRSWGV